MKRSQRVKAILLGLFLAAVLVLASCGPFPARVDTEEREAYVGGPRHGMEIKFEAVPPDGVPVLCHGQAPAGVASIELDVNGSFIGRSVNTAAPGTHEFTYFTAQMSFQPDAPGHYDLRCRTQDQEGRTVNSAVVTIFLFDRLPTPATWVPPETPWAPVPTATPTSTEVPPTAVPPTAVPPTAVPPTAVPPTSTPLPPTSTPTTPPPPTPVPPTRTPLPPSPTLDDRTGPSITNVNPIRTGRVCNGQYCGGPNDPTTIDISATVTDLSGVRSVEFYCTEPGYSERNCGAFVRIGGDNWVFTYDPEGFTTATVTYRIKATDDSPPRNVSWWGTGYIQVYEIIG
jgi:hypothetical protein